jgi:hypothetical protein
MLSSHISTSTDSKQGGLFTLFTLFAHFKNTYSSGK